MQPHTGMTSNEALFHLETVSKGHILAERSLGFIRELVAGLAEVACPECGATIRARMADHAPSLGEEVG